MISAQVGEFLMVIFLGNLLKKALDAIMDRFLRHPNHLFRDPGINDLLHLA